MLKNHLWEVYELAQANDRPVDIGLDLLVHNLENLDGPVFYPGAPELDYAPLAAKWETMTPEEKAADKNEARAILRDKYDALCAAWREHDREAFEAVVNGDA